MRTLISAIALSATFHIAILAIPMGGDKPQNVKNELPTIIVSLKRIPTAPTVAWNNDQQTIIDYQQFSLDASPVVVTAPCDTPISKHVPKKVFNNF